jgi:diguanylate cyclase (GGDEF)-like protein
MHAPHTYRFRLAFHVAVLLAYLAGVLLLTYRTSSDLVLHEAESNLTRVAQQLAGQIKIESADLAERARMVRDNASFQEYLFIATSLGTDPAALREQYRRQFGWLQIDRSVVLAHNGHVLIGAPHRDLADAVAARGLVHATKAGLFYFDGASGLEMVAAAPVRYRSQRLGTVVLTRVLDQRWMATVRELTGGELLLVKDGRITLSTLGPELAGQDFPHAAERAALAGEPYLMRRVGIDTGFGGHALYLALSHAELTTRLIQQRNILLGLVIAGSLGILMIGFMLLRNFSAPLGRLVAVMQEVSEGRYPQLDAGPVRDEISYLTNHVAAMVTGLREKQDEIRRVHDQLEQQATTDVLTGCYNRRYLYDLYPKLWAEAQRNEKRPVVLLIDLDMFKQVNDAYGHLVGDEVLRHFVQILRSCCRVSDFLVRLGGEEFLVLTAVDSEGSRVLAEKIRAGIESNPMRHDNTSLRVTVSIGVAEAMPEDGVNGLSAVLSRADRALYRAKRSGRNRVVMHNERQRHSA